MNLVPGILRSATIKYVHRDANHCFGSAFIIKTELLTKNIEVSFAS
jgi:hypothetical protein